MAVAGIFSVVIAIGRIFRFRRILPNLEGFVSTTENTLFDVKLVPVSLFGLVLSVYHFDAKLTIIRYVPGSYPPRLQSGQYTKSGIRHSSSIGPDVNDMIFPHCGQQFLFVGDVVREVGPAFLEKSDCCVMFILDFIFGNFQ